MDLLDAIKSGDLEKVRGVLEGDVTVDANGPRTKEFTHGMCLPLAIEVGSMDVAVYLSTRVSPQHVTEALPLAVERGWTEFVKDCASLPGVDLHWHEEFVFRRACENGHLELARWLVKAVHCNVHARDEYAIGLAAQNGHLPVVKWLVDEMGVPANADDDYALAYAARKGHLTVVEWLLERGASVQSRDQLAVSFAAGNGHAEVVKTLLRNGGCSNQAMENAASGRHLELCRWLDETYVITPLLAAGAVVFMTDANISSLEEFMPTFRVVDALARGFDVWTTAAQHELQCVSCSFGFIDATQTIKHAPMDWPTRAVLPPVQLFPGPE